MPNIFLLLINLSPSLLSLRSIGDTVKINYINFLCEAKIDRALIKKKKTSFFFCNSHIPSQLAQRKLEDQGKERTCKKISFYAQAMLAQRRAPSQLRNCISLTKYEVRSTKYEVRSTKYRGFGFGFGFGFGKILFKFV